MYVHTYNIAFYFIWKKWHKLPKVVKPKKTSKKCYNEVDTFKVILSLPNGPLCLAIEKVF